MTKTTSIEDASVSKPFWIAAAIVACSILGVYIWIASIDWFVSDDFAFLFYVQQPWSWTKVFFPLERPFWWTYRPIGMDGYFYLAFRLFGWNAQGFFAIVIITHALTAATVFRLGRQLGFDARSAVFAAMMAVSRFPSITNLTLACCFHYVAALFFLVLTMSLFIDYARKAKRRFLVVACFIFLLGLLCNELVLTVPFLLALIALYDEVSFFSLSVLRRVAVRVLPFLVIAGLFVLFRYGILTYPDPPVFYKFILSSHIFGNVIANLIFLAGSRNALYTGLSILVLMAVAVCGAKKNPVGLWSLLLRRHMVVLPWLFGMSVVLAALPFPQERFAMTLQIPVALLLAVWLDALLTLYRAKYRRVLEVAVVLFLVVSLPWTKVVARAAVPKGIWMRDLQRTVMKTHRDLPHRAVIVILYGGLGQAGKPIADEIDVLGFRASVIRSRYPNRRIDVRYKDIFDLSASDVLRQKHFYFELLPSRAIRPIAPKQIIKKMKEFRSIRAF